MRHDPPPMEPQTFVIAAGGTAGHVVPALAIADALRADARRRRASSSSGASAPSASSCPAAGLRAAHDHGRGPEPLEPAEGRARRRQGRRARCARPARSSTSCGPPRCSAAAATSPARSALAAVRRGIPLVLTEADSHLGLTNRLLARRARRVCLAFPIEGRTGERYRVTGRPVPPPATDRAAARARFGLDGGDTVVLVFGGSLGARSVNDAAVGAWGAGDPGFRVLHAGGRARPRRAARAPRATRRRPGTTCAASSPGSARRCSRATSSSRAPADRSSRSRRPAGPRSSSPTRTPRATTRPRTRAGWSGRAPRSSSATAS